MNKTYMFFNDDMLNVFIILFEIHKHLFSLCKIRPRPPHTVLSDCCITLMMHFNVSLTLFKRKNIHLSFIFWKYSPYLFRFGTVPSNLCMLVTLQFIYILNLELPLARGLNLDGSLSSLLHCLTELLILYCCCFCFIITSWCQLAFHILLR